jgi:hypothetical protein
VANGTSNEVITLPKGGGAQHGLGEKFSPDLHTGTGNFTVPISLQDATVFNPKSISSTAPAPVTARSD